MTEQLQFTLCLLSTSHLYVHLTILIQWCLSYSCWQSDDFLDYSLWCTILHSWCDKNTHHMQLSKRLLLLISIKPLPINDRTLEFAIASKL